MLYLAVDAHRHDSGRWCAQAVPTGVAEAGDPVITDVGDALAPRWLRAHSLRHLQAQLDRFVGEFLAAGCVVSAVYSLDGDPAAWSLLTTTGTAQPETAQPETAQPDRPDRDAEPYEDAARGRSRSEARNRPPRPARAG